MEQPDQFLIGVYLGRLHNINAWKIPESLASRRKSINMLPLRDLLSSKDLDYLVVKGCNRNKLVRDQKTTGGSVGVSQIYIGAKLRRGFKINDLQVLPTGLSQEAPFYRYEENRELDDIFDNVREKVLALDFNAHEEDVKLYGFRE